MLRFRLPFRLTELERFLRHCLSVVKTAAKADCSRYDDGANDQNAHGLAPHLILEQG